MGNRLNTEDKLAETVPMKIMNKIMKYMNCRKAKLIEQYKKKGFSGI